MRSEAKTNNGISRGTALERDVAAILKLMPRAQVQQQVEITGKKVDIYCVLPHALFPSFRIAVECKDWKSPLTREQCSKITSEYHALLDQNQVDQFLLVTRNGIVPNARKLFDARRYQHLSFSELADKVFDPGPLVENMRTQYLADNLDAYYIPQKAFVPDIQLVRSRYDFLYNEFLEFSLEIRAHTLDTALFEWKQYGGSLEITNGYTEDTFEQCRMARSSLKKVLLDEFVFNWIALDDFPFGLALLGSYGTGKSSFARHLAYRCSIAFQAGKLNRIPFLIELKDFGSHQDIRGLITHELVNRHGVANGSFGLFQSLNAAGRFVLILDGFDEMKQGMTADSLLYNFNQLASLQVGRSKILICGRPTIFESQLEQNKLLKGELALGAERTARYVQLHIAPFSLSEVSEFLKRYSETRDPDSAPRVGAFLLDLAQEASNNSELHELVCRPVHLPMLEAVVATRRELRAKDIRRAELYDGFINAIIDREMLKRPVEFQSLYGRSDRRRFAIELAAEMFKKGQSRSIRMSEIPDGLIERFVRPGRPKDAVRRDLVSACFLERKPPDVLFFPHKSFVEFLTAEHFRDVLRRGQQTALEIGLDEKDEVFSFLVEMLREEDWLLLAESAAAHRTLLTTWFDYLARRHLRMPEAVVRKFYESASALPSGLLGRLVDYYERVGGDLADPDLVRLSETDRALLWRCLAHPWSVVSVHAFRALRRHYAEPNLEQLAQLIGAPAVADWIVARWIIPSEDDKVDLERLLKLHLLYLLSVKRH
jgi:NACHT domain